MTREATDGRSIPAAGSHLRPAQRILRIAGIGVVALLLPLSVYAFREAARPPEARRTAPAAAIGEIAGPEAEAVLQALERAPGLAPAVEPEVRDPFALLPPLPEPDPMPDPAERLDAEAYERKGESDILVFRAGAGVASTEVGADSALAAVAADFAPTLLGRRLGATALPVATARRLTDLGTRLLQGTLIGCVLETAISSAVPGLATCRTRLPVFSADGSHELIAPGTRVLGEYQGGLEDGRSRIFVLWNRLVTPDGTAVSLASPGAGPLGRGGHAGFVDRKWAERIAAALMVSLITDVAEEESEGGLTATRDAALAVATDLVRAELVVRSELTKLQGERITIVVARDVDFREALESRFEQAGREADPHLFAD